MGKLRNAKENLHPSTIINPSFLDRTPDPLPKTPPFRRPTVGLRR
jgi:hypothetical protein